MALGRVIVLILFICVVRSSLIRVGICALSSDEAIEPMGGSIEMRLASYNSRVPQRLPDHNHGMTGIA